MTRSIRLLPQPQHLTLTGGTLTLPSGGVIGLCVPRPADLLFTAQRLQGALLKSTGRRWTFSGGDAATAVALTLDPTLPHDQGYRLIINGDGVQVIGHDLAGVFYGTLTLIQLVETHGPTLPTLEIDDWPDFAARGVMLDISRDRVPTMETLYHLIDRLAAWKVNQFQLYIEHTFAYRNHREVWVKASPMTAEEMLALDAYCRERFIDFVPNQNSFGHMHRWFEIPRYLRLAETETPTVSPWGTMMPPFSLSPAVPETLDLLRELFDELLPNFTSPHFNVGCDETFDLGQGRSRTLVEQHGKGRVYLDFLLKIYDLVTERGRTMQFWGDIINQYPDLVPEVPKDTIALEWGYEADHEFPRMTRLFAESGIPFYVCPGTSSWRTIAGRTDNCTGNIRNAAENGLTNGAIGLLNTDWGDEGHWQTLPISYLGFVYGAALSWAFDRNRDLDLPGTLDTFVFHDSAGHMGRLAYDLGNIYQQPGVISHNSSLLFNLYHADAAQIARLHAQHPALAERLNETLDAIDDVMAPLDSAQMAVPDAALVAREFTLAARMLRHGAKRGLLAQPGSVDKAEMLRDMAEIEAEYRDLWLARCRPGGLADSVARLHNAGQMYR